MNNLNTNIDTSLDEDLLPEYDFTNGIRGKHYQNYKHGHSVTIYHEDGTKTVQEVPPENDLIILDPDVKKYFPDSKTVNSTLRSLIKLIPEK